MLQLLTAYVPINHFIGALKEVESFIAENLIERMVLDRSSLRIFHQPSMEWYHVVWKEYMYEQGLSVYWKVHPADPLFEECVKIGREKIIKENSGFNIDKFDIKYCKSLKEALTFD